MSASSTSRTRLLGLIFGSPLAIGLAVGVLVWQRGDAWKAKALDTLNEQIDGALSVGEVTLSWWHGFPDISVDVSDVALLQTTGDTLVAGERLRLALDFWSLLGDQPEIGSITLDGGRVLLELDEDGRWVDSPFKTATAEEDSSSKTWTLGTVVIRDCALNVESQGNMGATLHVDLLECALGSSPATMAWRGAAREIQLLGLTAPKLKTFELSTEGSWNSQGDGAWTTHGQIELQGMDATWTASKPSTGAWQASVVANDLSQKRLQRLLIDAPWEGKFEFDHEFSLEAELTSQEATVQWSTSKDAFQLAPAWTGLSMSLQGVAQGRGVVRRANGSWSWAIDHADISGPGWALMGSADPTSGNGVTVRGEASLDASTPFEAWVPGIPQSVSSILPVSGNADIQGDVTLDARGGVRSMHASVDARQLTGQLDGQPYQIDVRGLQLDSRHASADSLTLAWAGNNAQVDIEGLTWHSLVQGSTVGGKVNLRAESLVVDPILQWWDHLNRAPVTAAVLLPAGSELDVDVNADQVDWGGLRCAPVRAKTTVTHNRWLLRSVQVHGLEGHAHVEGQLSPGRAGWVLALRGSLDDVSAPALFSTFNNFGQPLLRHDHLGGALSTAGNLSMSWGLDGSWHPEHLTASLQTSVQHGRLRNLEVFDDIADYLADHRLMAPLVDPEDLRQRLKDVAFEPVNQRVDVRGEEVWLPETVIESSAMNVAIEGTYDFDSNIDYTLGFALRDLRASASDNVGVMEDDGLGAQVFLRMFGQVNQPEYTYDRDAAKTHRRAAFAAEKERLRNALSNRGEDSGPSDAESDAQPEDESNPVTPTNPSSQDKTSPDKPNRNPKKKKKDRNKDLFNPDDEDYL